jgi:hypothetical protein
MDHFEQQVARLDHSGYVRVVLHSAAELYFPLLWYLDYTVRIIHHCTSDPYQRLFGRLTLGSTPSGRGDSHLVIQPLVSIVPSLKKAIQSHPVQ